MKSDLSPEQQLRMNVLLDKLQTDEIAVEEVGELMRLLNQRDPTTLTFLDRILLACAKAELELRLQDYAAYLYHQRPTEREENNQAWPQRLKTWAKDRFR